MLLMTQSPEGEQTPYGMNKNNWKFLLIVIVVAIIAGGGDFMVGRKAEI